MLDAARQLDGGAGAVDGRHLGRQEVHLRAADEAGDEQVARMVVELERRARLLDDAGLQHHDLVGHGHGLDLVVGDVDHGRLELVVQPGELDPHLHAQGGVEVGERLVEQEHLGLATIARPIATRWRWPPDSSLGLRVEQLVEMQDARRLADLPAALLLGHPGQPQREAHIVADRHVRVERVGLEHHGEAALGRRHVVDALAVDRAARRR